MPLSAIIPSTSQPTDKESANESANKALPEGYELWLQWLQRLLSASNLTLFSCEYEQDQLRLMPLAGVPSMQASASLTKLVRRCASSCSTVQALSDTAAEHSVVCVPDLEQTAQLRARHVLLIQRQKTTSFDPRTQARLVSWAFQSLALYVSTHDATSGNSTLVSWSLSQLESKATSASTFTRMMNTLRDASNSERCVLARLQVKSGRVTGARLLAMSGQSNVGKKMPSSDTMLIGINKAFAENSLPLQTVYEACVEPACPGLLSIAASRRRCSRIVIPVTLHGQWFAVSLERDAARPYSPIEQKHLDSEVTAGVVMTLLSDSGTLSLSAAVKRRGKSLYQTMTANVPRSAVICAAAFSAAVLLLYPVEQRVSAPLSVEASERHVLIAPSDGFVKTVKVKAGDVVARGETLASLDDRDLKLEQQTLESEALQNQQVYAKALASHNRVDITRLKEEASLIQTRLLQIEGKLDRMVLKAPVDGVVLSGSWDDFLGAAVAGGDTLFSLGSTHSHRLVLDVSEYDVKAIQPGQTVGIRLSADPSRVLSARVTAIMPLTMARAGVNSVQVHAVLDRDISLRPGMQGIGKVLVGRQSRLIQWLSRAGARLTWLAWKTGLLE